jgi:hypothetical protein
MCIVWADLEKIAERRMDQFEGDIVKVVDDMIGEIE